MSLLPVVSYGLASIAYALLALLLWAGWQGRRIGLALVVAALATAVWSALLAWAAWFPLPAVAVEVAELLKLTAWLFFLTALLHPLCQQSRWLGRLRVGALIVAAIALFAAVGLRLVGGALLAPVEGGLQWTFVVSVLSLAVIGLIILEQLYRNGIESRNALTFLCVAVGGLLVYDLYLYSDALLFQRINPISWDARGLVNALCVPLLLVAARRNTDWHLQVFVSRDVAFHSAVVAASGLYLVVFALGGYYVRDFGGTWGEFAQIVVLAAGAITLGLFLTSERLRRHVRVLISKHFFNKKYDYREEWLRLTSRLAEEDDGLDPYQRSVHVIADVLDVPGGTVWRLGEEGYERVAGWPANPGRSAVIDGDCDLVKFLVDTQWILDVVELRHYPDRYGQLELPSSLAGASEPWLILPLWHRNTLRGFITLDSSRGKREITWEDRDLLKTFGRQVAAYISQHEDALALAQAQQFEAFSRLTAFLMHDLKNLIAQQSLIVRNADKHRHNPEFIDDALETIAASVGRMERLLEHLQRGRRGGVVERVDVQTALQEVAQRCADRAPQPQVQVDGLSTSIEADREEFVMVLLHLVRNAQDATPPDGSVGISAFEEGPEVVIEIADNGAGMSEDFVRRKLFQPFYTTKSAKGMGIGAHQAREFIRTHDGRLSVWSRPGEGSRFTIRLPIVNRSG